MIRIKRMITSSYGLKSIACITMLIDHIGAVILPHIFFLRVIGRLAFPIFAFMISEGFLRTRNLNRYMMRFLVFAFISQIPFGLAFGNFDHPNVLFTLLAALAGISAYSRTKTIVPAVLLGVAAEILNFDWGFFGVILPLIFYANRLSKARIFAISAFTTLLYDSFQLFEAIWASGAFDASYFKYSYVHMSWFAVLPLILSYDANSRSSSLESSTPRNTIIKYSFYAFYPAHLLVLGLIKSLYS